MVLLAAAAIAPAKEGDDGDDDASSEQLLAEATSLGARREARLRLILKRSRRESEKERMNRK